jgi:6,7-dimethyl-8-ribityllumazine synthase
MARVLIVIAGFYAHIREAQLAAARGALEAGGHDHDTIEVPGALEIPGAIALASAAGGHDAYVALGCVIRGETFHFEIVAGESARGLMALTLDGLAIGNGILTVENEAQALARIPKAAEAVEAALSLASLRQRFAAA